MRVLIMKDYVRDAGSIKKTILANLPSIEYIIVCASPEEAIEQIKNHGTHIIVLDLTQEAAVAFLAQVKDHPHRIINTAQNSYPDYFTARLLGLNSINSLVKTVAPLSPADNFKHSPAFTV